MSTGLVMREEEYGRIKVVITPVLPRQLSLP